ncbi:MAG: peptidoglycan-associated lipoprotein Pal [Paracoccaceae bacterium]|nr:peptidoglycan-associated lipoprotein Pal [Paracoccaceae bacterium]
MTLHSKVLIGLMALVLSACTDPGRFGGGGDGAGIGMGGDLGSPSDPTSMAYFQQTVGDRVLFAVDESTLNAEAKATLEEQAIWLLANTEYSAVIEGHADEQGTREYNLGLGARRASAVQEYLISRGVSPARLRTVTYGKERPIEICSNESCYSKNRRAVTVLTVSGMS